MRESETFLFIYFKGKYLDIVRNTFLSFSPILDKVILFLCAFKPMEDVNL